MLLWWMLDRVGQGRPGRLLGRVSAARGECGFARGAGPRVGFPLRVSLAAGALFLVAPAEREAALWFSASTDLLATLATWLHWSAAAPITEMGTLEGFPYPPAMVRGEQSSPAPTRLGWRAVSVVLAALAYFSKETALVLPLLGVAALWGRAAQRRLSLRALVTPVLPHLVVAVGYLAVRFAVLRGLGAPTIRLRLGGDEACR